MDEGATSFVATVPVPLGNEGSARVGDYELVASQSRADRRYTRIGHLGEGEWSAPLDIVWVRGRVATLRAKGNSCFMVLRDLNDATETAQACYFKEKEAADASKQMLKWLAGVPEESVVDVEGRLVEASVKSCSRSNVEIQLRRCFVVARAPTHLPFLVADAQRSEAEIVASQETDKPFASVGQEARLDNRWLDMRTPTSASVFRLQAAVCRLFRSALDEAGFIEIHSPKLIAGESESGSGVFTTDYFGSRACLAQSPQLYKQMAIAGDLGRVYEIGPVFRAEKSNTRRHLCEFTGLDFEMAIAEHYLEAVEVAHRCFRTIFAGLETDYAKELTEVRARFPSEPPRIPEEPLVIRFDDALEMLRSAGVSDIQDDDLSTAHEIELGKIVKRDTGFDFYVVDRYPTRARPFYTMPCIEDESKSNSYDFFLRGQEICSGAQRCHDPRTLRRQLLTKNIDADDPELSASLKSYLTALDHVAPPHAGCGFGLERIVFLYLNLDNIRSASLFPRDPRRCAP